VDGVKLLSSGAHENNTAVSSEVALQRLVTQARRQSILASAAPSALEAVVADVMSMPTFPVPQSLALVFPDNPEASFIAVTASAPLPLASKAAAAVVEAGPLHLRRASTGASAPASTQRRQSTMAGSGSVALTLVPSLSDEAEAAYAHKEDLLVQLDAAREETHDSQVLLQYALHAYVHHLSMRSARLLHQWFCFASSRAETRFKIRLHAHITRKAVVLAWMRAFSTHVREVRLQVQRQCQREGMRRAAFVWTNRAANLSAARRLKEDSTKHGKERAAHLAIRRWFIYARKRSHRRELAKSGDRGWSKRRKCLCMLLLQAQSLGGLPRRRVKGAPSLCRILARNEVLLAKFSAGHVEGLCTTMFS
jgi:hypothetical protein